MKITFREFVEHQGKHMSYKTCPRTFLLYHMYCSMNTTCMLNTTYDMYHTSMNHGSRVKPYMCAVTLNGMPLMMEIDTGATTSIISSRQFEQIRQGSQQLQLTTENLPTLRTYSGHMIHPAGGVAVDVRHQELSYPLPCF